MTGQLLLGQGSFGAYFAATLYGDYHASHRSAILPHSIAGAKNTLADDSHYRKGGGFSHGYDL